MCPIDVNLDIPNPVVVGVTVGIPSIPTISLAVDIVNIPKIQVGIDPIVIRLTEIPDVRMHLPVNFNIGLSVLGMELMNLGLCGEAQVITEPYHPNPCEVCGPVEWGRLLREAELAEAFSSGPEVAS
ncbi:MAG TPA: hypothetical protein VHG28_13610 [Longimicrobiaceae bacterium]|nr:hypothetical protein [Longimicrobiaceae bacterium]